MELPRLILFAALGTLGFASGAKAIAVSYALVDLGGNLFRYEYTITNDPGAPSIRLVDLFFDPSLYDETSLTDASSGAIATGWNRMFLASGIGVPAAFDALASDGGIPAGGSSSGFAVEFRWRGSGLPGAQGFEIYDPVSFVRLAAGTTTLAAPDTDGDGLPDSSDNCPYYPNSNQLDTDQDMRGNACECSDQNGDGRNTVADLVAINRAIFDPTLVTPLCDGNGDGSCNVADILAANLEIFSPGHTSTCARQRGSAP
jgi:hypothetical protein